MITTRSPGWEKRMHEPRPTAVESTCAGCGGSFWLPRSKVEERRTCSAECVKLFRQRKHDELVRPCAACGTLFRPRFQQLKVGHGRYCSHACAPAGHLISADALAHAHERRRQNQAAGLITWKTGPDHHSWKGGQAESVRRQIASGKRAAGVRAYRAKNPHKVREFSVRRHGRKLGRLEYGSIPRIGKMQGWKCAICKAAIKNTYHVDHIIPLARGGEHRARNIQLLCRSCNVRKSAKDPIEYMQQLGRLL